MRDSEVLRGTGSSQSFIYVINLQSEHINYRTKYIRCLKKRIQHLWFTPYQVEKP